MGFLIVTQTCFVFMFLLLKGFVYYLLPCVVFVTCKHCICRKNVRHVFASLKVFLEIQIEFNVIVKCT